MNIQIYGKSKCFDTKKAERYFKERRIKYQYIDLEKYGMSLGEYRNIKAAIGSIDGLIDEKSKAYEKCFIKYLAYPAAVISRINFGIIDVIKYIIDKVVEVIGML